jgi:hypothetical protein
MINKLPSRNPYKLSKTFCQAGQASSLYALCVPRENVESLRGLENKSSPSNKNLTVEVLLRIWIERMN